MPQAITCPEVPKAAAPMEPPESEQGLLCGARHPNRAKEDPKSAGAAKGRRFKNPKKKATRGGEAFVAPRGEDQEGHERANGGSPDAWLVATSEAEQYHI